ncbi:MAG: hypothetical protein ACYSUF_07935 [Planctomycetota bacterium]
MDIADRIPDAVPAPPVRGIRVVHHHRHEQRQEAARAPATRPVVVDRMCLADAACRDELRAAVSEISRLQRGILTAGERAFLEQLPRWLEDRPPDPKAAPPTERKAYAPPGHDAPRPVAARAGSELVQRQPAGRDAGHLHLSPDATRARYGTLLRAE